MARPRGAKQRAEITRDRLAQLYGARASFRLEPGEHGGTVATLAIPITNGDGDG